MTSPKLKTKNYDIGDKVYFLDSAKNPIKELDAFGQLSELEEHVITTINSDGIHAKVRIEDFLCKGRLLIEQDLTNIDIYQVLLSKDYERLEAIDSARILLNYINKIDPQNIDIEQLKQFTQALYCIQNYWQEKHIPYKSIGITKEDHKKIINYSKRLNTIERKLEIY